MTIEFYAKLFSRIQRRSGSFLLGLVAGRRLVASLRESLPKVEHAQGLMKQGKDCLFYHAPVVVVTHAESWTHALPLIAQPRSINALSWHTPSASDVV